MRLMLDTNIFIYYSTDQELLSKDVHDMLDSYDNLLCLSMESIKELIVAYRVKKVLQNYWKTPEDMILAVQKDYWIKVETVDINVMKTYAKLQINEAQEHKDPSDHLIISHAITLGIPLISSDKKFPFYKSQGLDLIENFK